MSHAEERPSPGRRAAAEEGGKPSAARRNGDGPSPAAEAMRQARRAASTLAADANRRIAGLLDRQVASGADLAGHVAGSVRAAAENLDREAPQLAELARLAADRIEDVSETIRDQSAADLFESASDFARRRPAVVFGAAALAGFLLYRVLSAAPPSRGRGRAQARDADSAVTRRPGTRRKPVRRAASGAGKRRPTHGA